MDKLTPKIEEFCEFRCPVRPKSSTELVDDSNGSLLVRTSAFQTGTSVYQILDTSKGLCKMTCTPDGHNLAETEVLVSLSEVDPSLVDFCDEQSLEMSEVGNPRISDVNSSLTDTCDRQNECSEESLAISTGSQADVAEEPKKKKGGWPKGKRRKAFNNCKAPKAPTTGYILFLNERRKYYKETQPDAPFADVTKILGHEWTNLLAADQKQKYLDLAIADKKRYREELEAYRKTDYYRAMKKKRQLESNNNCCQSAADSGGSDQLEPCSELTIDLGPDTHDEDSNELYCKICDLLFNSLHNKKEHMYGRQHLQAMTSEVCKASPGEERHNSESGEAKTADCLYVRLSGSSTTQSNTPVATNVDQAIHDFIEITLGRVVEIRELKNGLAECRKLKDRLITTMNGLKLLESTLVASLKSLKTEEVVLKDQLENLRMVPALFGVINFQHQT